MPPGKPTQRRVAKKPAKKAAKAPNKAAARIPKARLAGVASPIDTDAVVDACIARAAPGRPYTNQTQLRVIPVRSDDLNNCLNTGLDLVDPYRYTSGQILPTWTVRMLKTDAHNRYLASHPSQ